MSTNSPKRVVEADIGFEAGQNTSLDPVKIGPGGFVCSVNMLNRGGALRTRPGFHTAFTLPDGNLQGLGQFVPRKGKPQLIAAVDGALYVSAYPYTTFRRCPGESMDPKSRFVFWCNTTKSAERNADKSLKLITPKNLLVIQDGIAPPAFWDGANVVRASGTYATPQGTHMAWSGDRLWVARDNQLFAGDIGDPTGFYEQTYNQLGGLQSFFLRGKITGLTKVPGINAPTLLAFTATSGTSFRADIRSRDAWSTTPDFQVEILPTVGCVAHRSLTARAGQLNWYSAQGATSLDAAQFSLHSTRVALLDTEMARSKRNLWHDRSGIASTCYDNLLLTSVPEGGKLNRHTWVHDAAPVATSAAASEPAWASTWTGVNPVEWVVLNLDGQELVFCASKDADGKNRVYRAFTQDFKDNGVDIPWSFETRAVTAGTVGLKQLRDMELTFSGISGQLDVKFQWAGALRGRWKDCGSAVFKAGVGSLSYDRKVSASECLFACKTQSRTVRSNDVMDLPPDVLASTSTESPFKESLDRAFMARISGSGRCAVRSLRIFMDLETEPTSGEVSVKETEEKFVRFDGAAGALRVLQATPVTFSSTRSAVAEYRGYRFHGEATVTSLVSQSDADKRAAQLASVRADTKLKKDAPKRRAGTV